MKLKYYLRGLGIGVAVTALVLMVSGAGKSSLSDEEVIARAKELGMVENTTLSELLNQETSQLPEQNEDGKTSEVSQEGENPELTSEDSTEIGTEDVSEEKEDTSNSEEASEQTTETETSEETVEEFVVIQIGPGDGSDHVSIKLQNAGLVEDAEEFDDFLCSNGYDKILQTGMHEVPKTADWNTIAEILAGRK